MLKTLHYALRPGLIGLLVMLTFSVEGLSQRGDEHVYTFLELSPSARVTALGGTLISVVDDDVVQALQNPGALNATMHGSMAFQYHFLFDGIADGYAAYAHHFANAGITGHAGVQFVQYGTFDLADEFGNRQGTFKANELAINVGAAKTLGDLLTAGANLRFVQSNLESYHSSGLLMDIGATYRNPEGQVSLGLVVKNVGFQVSTYAGESEPVPIDVQLGLSTRLKYLPFRFSVTAHSLTKWDLLYDSPLDEEQTTVIGEEPRERSGFNRGIDNFFRHLIFSGEFLLGKEDNFRLRFAYDHQLRKELSVNSLRSFAGFSGGVGLRIKGFFIDFGLSSKHIAGSTKHIGISTNLSRFDKGIVN